MNFELMLRLLVLLLLGCLFLISGVYRNRGREGKEISKGKEEDTQGTVLRLAAATPLLLMTILNIFVPGQSAVPIPLNQLGPLFTILGKLERVSTLLTTVGRPRYPEVEG